MRPQRQRGRVGYGDRMRLKLVVVTGAAIGALAYLARRRTQKARADAALWAEATDPVAPSTG